MQFLCRKARKGKGFPRLAVYRYLGEQRNAAHRKALDVFQRQIHIQRAGHHTDFETRPLVGDIDVALERLFRQALFANKTGKASEEDLVQFTESAEEAGL